MMERYMYMAALFGFIILVFSFLVVQQSLTDKDTGEFTQPGGGFFKSNTGVLNNVKAFFGMLWDAITFNIPGMPTFLRIIFSVAVALPLLYVVIDLMIRVLQAIADLIPF